MAAKVKAPAAFAFDQRVEEAIIRALESALEPADRIRCLAVAVRFLAVKAKLVTSEHGSAFDDDDDPIADLC